MVPRQMWRLLDVCRSWRKWGMLFRVMALGWLIPKL
jgi:hypothetical protein